MHSSSGRERGRERERRENECTQLAHSASKRNGKIEHIFVTYLPIRWVQTNKMEKVKVIRRDEWISLDIYSQ